MSVFQLLLTGLVRHKICRTKNSWHNVSARSRSNSADALVAFGWTCVLLRAGYASATLMIGSEFAKLVLLSMFQSVVGLILELFL